MKIGTRVRMSAALKKRLAGKCGEQKKHIGPIVNGSARHCLDGDCWACSSWHVEEFGGCTGVIVGPTLFDDSRATKAMSGDVVEAVSGTAVDVRWEPSGMRYAYCVYDLEEANA